MSRFYSYTLRGEEMDIEVDHDGGYESDTNAYIIEWHFIGLTPEQHDALNLTQDEIDAIEIQLAQLEEEDYYD